MWRAALRRYWRAYVPPCRPSRFDLDVCSAVVAQVRRWRPHCTPNVLILGSTNEFRDWAFEEHCSVTVVDNSRQFHVAISDDRRYKRSRERLVVQSWETLDLPQRFDLALGDLVVGNVAPSEVAAVLQNVYRALRPRGTFITKSFFARAGIARRGRDVFPLLRRIEELHPLEDPFPHMVYALTLAAVDRHSGMLSFPAMYALLERAFERGYVSARVLRRYRELGWHAGSKIEFYVMPERRWIKTATQVFERVTKRVGPYSWSKNFPVYLLHKRGVSSAHVKGAD